MKISFDPGKNEKNIRERGLSFARAVDFDFVNATFLIDNRHNYGEVRHIAIGYLDRRLHFLCFVEKPNEIRIISFRKANTRESKKYGKLLTIDQ